MKAWDFESKSGLTGNSEKMKDLRALFPATEPLILWHFLVFVHRCNFQGTLDPMDTQAVLNMLQGPMYTEAAFVAMETPLLNKLITLRSELKDKDINQYFVYEERWDAMAYQMRRARDSSHRVLKQGEGRANEYFVAART
jgi:hypothetical protein